MPKFLPESLKGSIIEAQQNISFPYAVVKGHKGDYYLAQENDDRTYTDLGIHFHNRDELKNTLLNQYIMEQLMSIYGSSHISLNMQLVVEENEEPYDYLEFVPLVELSDFDSDIPARTRHAFIIKQQEIIARYSDTIHNTDTCIEDINAIKNNAIILNEFCNQVHILIQQNSVKYMGNLPEFKKTIEKRMSETKALYDTARRDLQILDDNLNGYKTLKKEHNKNLNELKKIIATTNIPLDKFDKLRSVDSRIYENLDFCEQFYKEKATTTRSIIMKALRNYKDLENFYRAKQSLVRDTQQQASR